MYNQKVMEIFTNPKHVGEMKNASGVGTVGNEACGDIMRMYVKIDENNVITNATFKTFGCAAAIVSSSVACDLIIGKTVEEALKLTNKDIIKTLGELPNQKIHCSMLATEALNEAVNDFKKKQKKENKNTKKQDIKSVSNSKETQNSSFNKMASLTDRIKVASRNSEK